MAILTIRAGHEDECFGLVAFCRERLRERAGYPDPRARRAILTLQLRERVTRELAGTMQAWSLEPHVSCAMYCPRFQASHVSAQGGGMRSSDHASQEKGGSHTHFPPTIAA